jgi:hypothetical protein
VQGVALIAGCRFFAGYPITPATEIAEHLSVRMPELGGIYIQMEDEIGAISAVIGSSWGGLLIIVTSVGIHSALQLKELGHSVDVVLRENYESVLACQEMKESLERMDSGALFTILGHEREGKELLTVWYNKLPENEFRVIGVEEPFIVTLPELAIPLIGFIDLIEEDNSIVRQDRPSTSTLSPCRKRPS